MEHELDVAVVTVVAASALVWSLVAARLERINISAPMAFVVLGLVSTHGPLAVIEIHVDSSTARSVAEITLALVLFVDASRVNVRALRHDAALPVRLLGVGLPLTIGAGFLAGAALYRGTGLWVVAAIAAAVAPTDAALGAAIMQDSRVPGRIRRVLNVESGLNDGIATPFVGIFLAGAAASEDGSRRRQASARRRSTCWAAPAWESASASSPPCSCDRRGARATAHLPSAR